MANFVRPAFATSFLAAYGFNGPERVHGCRPCRQGIFPKDLLAKVMPMNSCVEHTDQVQTIHMLVDRARSGVQVEMRHGRRFPFFQPVTLCASSDQLVSLPAFARDISPLGIGLLSSWPVSFQPVQLRIHLTDNLEVELAGVVRWCQPCGQGWYTIGVGFQHGESDEASCPIGGFTG